jgi:hypothetical protein
VSLMIDGVLYVKVVDPKLASYGVENAMCAALWVGERPRAPRKPAQLVC